MSEVRTSFVQIEIPEDCNVIVGQSHFVKTVEDLYEALATSSPSLKFGIAFCEASLDRLIRRDGNDSSLIECATRNAQEIAAGHTFVIVIKDGYPINILGRVKNVQEVCHVFAATANPLQLIIAETDQGRGVIGVIDGQTPLGVEGDSDVEHRRDFLRKITGYKR